MSMASRREILTAIFNGLNPLKEGESRTFYELLNEINVDNDSCKEWMFLMKLLKESGLSFFTTKKQIIITKSNKEKFDKTLKELKKRK